MNNKSTTSLGRLCLMLVVCCVTIEAGAASLSGRILLAMENSALMKSTSHGFFVQEVNGTVTDDSGEPLPGVTVLLKGSNVGTVSDRDGNFILEIPDDHENPVLAFSFVGYQTQEVPVGNRTTIDITMAEDRRQLDEVVVVGYGEQKKASVTGSIGTVSSEDITDVPAPTISQALIGKVAGINTRVPDGRPGSAANLQIRNLGAPLYIIDGVPSGGGNFNQLGPDDIESISILKDASAAIYGLQASNGVVLVTTKKGKVNQENKVNVNTYYGWQSLTRFPKPASAGDYVRAHAEADINDAGSSVWTRDEVEKWQQGTEDGYRGFDWSDFAQENVPQKYLNVNTSGGSKKTNYYLSVSRLDQDAVFEAYNFNRTNIQTNIETRIRDRWKAGVRINGKIESREYPGVPGGDRYGGALLGMYRNLPIERPFANDNPLYPAKTFNDLSNYGLFQHMGYYDDQWRSLQTSFDLEYKFPVEGLTAKAMYAFFYNNQLQDMFQYAYNTYTYNEDEDSYEIVDKSTNRNRYRRNRYITDNIFRTQLDYQRAFGEHNVSAMVGVEANDRLDKNSFIRSTPATNYIELINEVSEVQAVTDDITESARAGFIFRATYNYKEKYLLEIAGRYDGSWRFPPGHRWGLFPSVSAGWRITEEAFLQNSNITNVLDDFKLRASYGEMGSEPNIGAFAYLPGYNWGAGNAVLDGELVTGIAPRDMPVRSLSWIKSAMTNVGFDFSLWNGKLSGSMDGFYRERTGLKGQRYDILIPTEVSIPLPPENLGGDAHMGIEAALGHRNSIGDFNYSVGGNITFARHRNLYTYKPRFGNSWDHYRNSSEDRWSGVMWGQEIIGRFQSEEQIANYPVDIDNRNNTTVLPGDFIYRDVNNDGVIDGHDLRPNGYGSNQLPYLSYGLHTDIRYKGIDLSLGFAGAALQSRGRTNELKEPFYADGNSPAYLLNDRWHREDIFSTDSPWIPGKYPALRKTMNQDHNFRASDFWYTNIAYLRLRTIQLGYTIPQSLTEKAGFSKVRFYINGTNLFSFDNLKHLGVDPETDASDGRQYPTHKVVNVGANITF